MRLPVSATAADDRSVGASLDVALTPKLVAHVDASWRKTDDLRIAGLTLSPQLRAEVLALADEEEDEGELEEAAELRETANQRGRVNNTASRDLDGGGRPRLYATRAASWGFRLSHFDSRYGVPTRPGIAHAHEGEGGEEEEGEELVTIGLKQWRVDVRGEVELGDGFFEKLRLPRRLCRL